MHYTVVHKNATKAPPAARGVDVFPKDGSLLGILNSKLFQKMWNQLDRNVTDVTLPPAQRKVILAVQVP